MNEPKPPPADASLWSVWKPILIAAGIGFVTAVATIGVLYAVWHPDGVGI